MQIPITDKNEIKIFVLYLMKNVGVKLDFNNISDIVIQDNIVSYFDFVVCLVSAAQSSEYLHGLLLARLFYLNLLKTAVKRGISANVTSVFSVSGCTDNAYSRT